MNDYTFFGKIHPERASLNITKPVILQGKSEKGEMNFSLIIHIYANQILVSAKISKELGFDIQTLRNFVTEHVRSIVDLTSFLYETGYEVEIISVINNNSPDQAETFGVRLGITGEDVEKRAERYSEIAHVIVESPHIGLALSDLRAAIRNPVDTGMYCYRAFESILHDFQGGTITSKNGSKCIAKLGTELNIGSMKSLKKYLGRYAGSRRHGGAVSISWDERKEIMKRAWLLMDRYIEYLKRGRAALSKNDFPEPDFSSM